tara:strand:- start:161 stop:589 length:429 start_codon:yes stop_codon:yes gene_type:complete
VNVRAGERRLGRELAMQSLYLAGQTEGDPGKSLPRLPGWHMASSNTQQFAELLIKQLSVHNEIVDQHITSVVRHWDRKRVARIDDCILRLGACELIAFLDIPTAVSINEAIELAKKYSTEQSGSFVNGVLDAVAAKNLTKSD